MSMSGTDTPLFSVVLPVYNQEKWLRPALDSVLSQRYEGDYEVIAVDDGSTDSSPAICDEYAARYPERVRVIHQPNRGTLQARTAGYAAARGRYMVSVDPDDLVSPYLLSEAARVIEETGADLVVFDHGEIGPDTCSLEGVPEGSGRVERVDRDEIYRAWQEGHMAYPAMWQKVFRRELYNFAKFSDYSYIGVGQDRLQGIDIEAGADSICYLDRVLYYYRLNPLSAMNSFPVGYEAALTKCEPLAYLIERSTKEGIEIPQEIVIEQYLQTIWTRVTMVAKSSVSYQEKRDVLSKIRGYDEVEAVRRHLPSATLPLRYKIGLRLFYARLYCLVIAYQRLIFAVRRLLT